MRKKRNTMMGFHISNCVKKNKPELIYENPDVYIYYQNCVTALGLQV